MQSAIAFAAILAVAAAGEFRTVVEGEKAIIAGPSGTIHADTGAIVKSEGFLAPRLLPAPFFPRNYETPAYLPRVAAPIAAPRAFPPTPLIAPRLYGSAPLLNTPFLNTPFLPHAPRSIGFEPLYNNGLYGHAERLVSPYTGYGY